MASPKNRNTGLTRPQEKFCRLVVELDDTTQAYLMAFRTPNPEKAKHRANAMLRIPEIKEFVSVLRGERGDKLNAEKEERIRALKEKVLTLTEIDVYHSQVVRGEIEVEEIFHVREPKKDEKGIVRYWESVFKKITRKPNLKERLDSATELYKRFGAYPMKPFFELPQNGNGEENGNGNGNGQERYVILSTGEQVPLP